MKDTIGHWDNSDRPSISKWGVTAHPDDPNSTFVESMRQMFREEIQLARETSLDLQPSQVEPGPRLHPIINKSHIGVEVQFTDFSGQKYRGVLYPSKEE